MRIYHKYILKNLLYPFITFCFVITAIVWITQTLKLIYLLDKGISFSKFFYLSLLILPMLFSAITPAAMICSVIYIYNQIKGDREIIIFKNSGLDYLRIAKPVFSLSLIVTLVAMFNSFYLQSTAFHSLKQNLYQFKQSYINSLIKEGSFSDISKNINLYVNKKNDNFSFEGIMLFDNRNEKYSSLLMAEKGYLVFEDESPKFYLINGSRQIIDNNNQLQIIDFEQIYLNLASDKSIFTRKKDTQERNIYELFHFEDANLNKNKLMTEGHNRIIWSLFNASLAILTIGIFLPGNINRRGYTKKIFLAIAAVLISILLHFIILNLANINIYFIIFGYLNVIGQASLGIFLLSKPKLLTKNKLTQQIYN